MSAKLLDLKAGRQFVDRYELIGEIASGGMATVYLARLTGVGGFQRLFAIKRLHPHLQSEKEFVEMFLDEARLAAGIHHPNVVPILEVGASDSGYYLVMEYIEGETLARLLARAASSKERLPVPIVIRMALDTLGGLHAAHELRDETGGLAGVVHRDVSPQNVLVGADGVARITDFGVARAASRLTATRVGQLKGKIAYMAPEQARGEEDLDRRADVFAAGIVLWESLAHRRLFKASSEAATLSRVLNEPLPHLRETAPHVSPEVCDVVMRSLERDRERRISTCMDFAEQLEAAAAKSGELGSARDLQQYMSGILGEEIRAQRDAIRVWTAQADTQGGGPPLHTPVRVGTNSGVERTPGLDVTQVSSNKGKTVGLLAAVLLLGAGGFFGYRMFQTDTATQTEVQGTLPHAAAQGGPQGEPTHPAVAEEPAAQIKDLKELGVPGGVAPDAASRPAAPNDSAGSEKPASAGKSGDAQVTDTSDPVATPKPAARPASGEAPAPAPGPTPKPRSKPNPLDALDSNPYR